MEPDTTKLIPIEGNNQPTITVHTTLLCHFSPYYRAAIEGGFSERDNEFFDIDVDARTLEIAVFWMYSCRMSPAEDGATLLEELVKVYLFADKYDFLALRRDVFARWLCADTPTLLVGFATINLAYACLPANSPLLRFLAMTYIHHWKVPKGDEPERIEDLKTAPAAFLAAVLVGKGDDQDIHTTWDNCDCFSRQCEFHEHENPAEREASRSIPSLSLPTLMLKII